MAIDLAGVERELCRIPEVRAARVVADERGHPIEVHVVATSAKHVKQIAREVQSVAMTSTGLDIDHRIVSVVQLDDESGAPPPPDPDDAPAPDDTDDTTVEADPSGHGDPLDERSQHARRDRTAEPAPTAERDHTDPLEREPEAFPATTSDRVLVESVTTTRRALDCTAQVTLRRGEQTAIGVAEGPMAASVTWRLVARATLDALRDLRAVALAAEVETATVTRLGDREVAVAAVVMVTSSHEEILVGAAPVRAGGDDEAVARAVLDATNRRLESIR